jgi:hypothetical protein
MFATDEGYVRGDYCTECWNKQEQAGTVISTWHGIFTVPPPEKEEPLKKETAESLLRKMMEDDEPNISVIYILAVMLERKRILVERDVQVTENSTIRIYEHKKTGETFLVTEPHLQLDKLEEVQIQVVELLGGSSGDRKSEDGGQRSEDGDQRSENGGQKSENSADPSDQSVSSDPSDNEPSKVEVLPES